MMDNDHDGDHEDEDEDDDGDEGDADGKCPLFQQRPAPTRLLASGRDGDHNQGL